MGLDLYLTKRTTIYNVFKKPEEQTPINVPGIKQERVSYIVEGVGYWRKANAIHQWFVKNVQDGVDDCKDYEVDREQLGQLLETVNEVIAHSQLIDGVVKNGERMENGKWEPILESGKLIADPSKAKELLPTQAGFFYGSTEYDQYYYDDLVKTQKLLTTILAEEDGYFHYHSSW